MGRRARDPETPAFQAELWEFIATATSGTALRNPGFGVACTLAGMVAELLTQVHMLGQGISQDEAEAKTAELIEAQRSLYASLARTA